MRSIWLVGLMVTGARAFASDIEGLVNPVDPSNGLSARALSSDGNVVAGYFYDGSNNVGFEWTKSTGVVGLGAFKGTDVHIESVNGDGSVLGGYTSTLTDLLWTKGSGYSAPNLTGEEIVGLSADGKVKISLGGDNLTYRATGPTGGTSLGLLPSSYWTSGSSVTDDGTTVVGTSFYNPLGDRPFVYQTGAGISPVPLVSGWKGGSGSMISRNGQYIVGSLTNGNGGIPFFWSQATGSILLSENLGEPYIDEVSAVSNQGVIFDIYKPAGGGNYNASVYDSYSGPEQDLKQWLTTKYGLGSQLSGWTLYRVQGVSADGTTIFGDGAFNGKGESWVAHLSSVPEPGLLAVFGFGLFGFFSAGRMRLRRKTRG